MNSRGRWAPRRIASRLLGVPLLLLLGAAVATLAAVAAASPRPELRPWPGPGFRTSQGSWMRPLSGDVSFVPLFSVGDTLLSPIVDEPNFVLLPALSGIGVRSPSRGLAEIYVNHETTWEDAIGSGRVSRLLLDTQTNRTLAADWIVDGYSADEVFEGLGAGQMAETSEGFLSPQFLVGETSTDGPNHGIVAAIDTRSGDVTPLPWLGHFRHGGTLVMPFTTGSILTIEAEMGDPGQSQLYLYMAEGDTDFLAGAGRLYVLRADAPPNRPDTRSAAMAQKSRPPLTGRFVPMAGYNETSTESAPPSLEMASQAAGALNFVRLGDVAPDRRDPYAFYVADLGDEYFMDPVSGRPVTGNGRIYHIALDPFDLTRVREIRVVLDGDAADDIYRPRDLESDYRTLMIQEDPGRRGIRPSRLLRYELDARRVDVLAECAERDPQGRMLPEGTGGLWRTSGIVDASAVFGPGSWLLAVQARNDRTTAFDKHGGGGQLLLMRTPDWSSSKRGKAEKP